jgi:glycosyltransferase involved in cell wall biosynthesis
MYILAPKENWICDRLASEWNKFKYKTVSSSPHDADIIWLLSSWSWDLLPLNLLNQKKVITTIHHIDPTKVDQKFKVDFSQRDAITDLYHVPCEKTKKQVEQHTSKKIFVQPFWVNQTLWFPIANKPALRQGLDLPTDKKLIGSFQRDTEGHDLKSPKLSKGPDIFCDIVEKMHKKDQNVEVVLAGWRRQYVIKRLEAVGIKYYYFEWANLGLLNKLYNCLDLYVVSSRTEGGPQAIVEAALTKTPIISTDVGLASKILSPESVYDHSEFDSAKPNTIFAYQNAQKYLIPNGFCSFENKFFDATETT